MSGAKTNVGAHIVANVTLCKHVSLLNAVQRSHCSSHCPYNIDSFFSVIQSITLEPSANDLDYDCEPLQGTPKIARKMLAALLKPHASEHQTDAVTSI